MPDRRHLHVLPDDATPSPSSAAGTTAPMDLQKEADLTQCGALKEFWYVACLSAELGNKAPLARTLFGLPIAVFRDGTGTARAVRDRCLHRGTPLSAGVVIDGTLCCPYHGWSYDGAGACVNIPSLGKTQQGSVLSAEGHAAHDLKLTPKDVGCLRTFPTREQDGLVYVFVGDAAQGPRKEPFSVPFWSDREWTVYYMVTKFSNGVTNLVENFMDVPHTVFVHRGWFRSPSQKRVPATVERRDGSVLVTYQQERDQILGLGYLLNPTGKEPMVHTDKYYVPNITRVDYTFGQRAGFVITSQCTPVGPTESIVYTAISYKLPFLPTAVAKRLERVFHWYTTQVITQDTDIMRVQRRGLVGTPLAAREPIAFASTEADLLHHDIEVYRRWLLEGGTGTGPKDATRDIAFWI